MKTGGEKGGSKMDDNHERELLEVIRGNLLVFNILTCIENRIFKYRLLNKNKVI